MKIYVASSQKNTYYERVVLLLRQWGHEVYDFRDSNSGFRWSEIDPEWESWGVGQWRRALDTPVAELGFRTDMNALSRWAEACVLVLPCGRSAHLELGWAAGANKRTAVYCPEPSTEPELMVKMCDAVVINEHELKAWLEHVDPAGA